MSMYSMDNSRQEEDESKESWLHSHRRHYITLATIGNISHYNPITPFLSLL
jgi:hypothetical protein